MTEPIATYNPALVTDLDWMRSRLGDTNPAAPYAPDVSYLAYLAAAGDNWRLAAAALARALASAAINRPNSINAPGDGAIAWGDRAAAWLKIAAELEAEASRLGLGAGSLWVAEVERADLIPDAGEYSVALRRS